MMEFVSRRFFETVGIPLLRGRDFSWSDDGQHSEVAIVNETLSRTLFAAADAIGQRIRIGPDPKRRAIEIVGIVRDVTMGNLRAPHLPVAFRPKMQEPQYARASVVTIRTSGDRVDIDTAVTRTVLDMGHEYVRRLSTLEEQVDASLIQERLMAALSSFFAGLAALLAFVGLYSLLAYAAARRTREIGIRMALGASRASVLRLVVREGLMVTLIGIAVGVPSALVAGRLTSTLLFGLTASDPTTATAVVSFVVLVGAAAGLTPAYRAMSVDPVAALQSE
jgi:predicted lysophospholipase L1 biosynthesis ABC-type transport system permease subunit